MNGAENYDLDRQNSVYNVIGNGMQIYSFEPRKEALVCLMDQMNKKRKKHSTEVIVLDHYNVPPRHWLLTCFYSFFNNTEIFVKTPP